MALSPRQALALDYNLRIIPDYILLPVYYADATSFSKWTLTFCYRLWWDLPLFPKPSAFIFLDLLQAPANVYCLSVLPPKRSEVPLV